jgi:hypothetical protein
MTRSYLEPLRVTGPLLSIVLRNTWPTRLGFARLFFKKATAGTLKPRLLRGHNYICQYAINGRIVSTVHSATFFSSCKMPNSSILPRGKSLTQAY